MHSVPFAKILSSSTFSPKNVAMFAFPITTARLYQDAKSIFLSAKLMFLSFTGTKVRPHP